MWPSFIRMGLGVLLIPAGIAITRTLGTLLVSSGSAGDGTGLASLLSVAAGAVTWCAVFCLLPQPLRTYVVAHELTHALWGALMGATIFKVKVAKTGGQVQLSHTNVWVTLAPYFFPLYTVVAVLVYYGISLFYDISPYRYAWLVLVGLTLGFHLTFTVRTLSMPQPDILAYGRFFSYVLIYVCHALFVSVLLILVSPLSGRQFLQTLLADLVWTWGGVLVGAGRLIRFLSTGWA